MKKVLIISRWFPPLNMIAAKRFGSMCRYFEQYGYTPIVLTSVAQRVAISGFSLELQPPIGENQIIRIGQMGTDYTPKNLLFSLLVMLQNRLGLFLNSLNGSALGRYEKLRSELDLCRLEGIDAIIATYPEMDSVFMARFISRKLKIPYIVDIRDMIDFSDGLPEGIRHDVKLDVMIEKLILRDAAALVAVTNGYKKVLFQRYPGKMIGTIYNGWDSEIREEISDNSRVSEHKYLYYAGTLYEHRLESLLLLAECVKEVSKTEKYELIIRSAGPFKYDRQIKRAIKNKGLTGFVRVLTPEAERVIRSEQQKSYINVVASTIHSDDKELMATIPGKVFELLPITPPIIAIVPTGSEVSKLLDYTSKGIGTIEKEQIKSFLTGGCEKYTGNNKIVRFSRKKQAERYCTFLNKVLDNPSTEGNT